MAVTRTIKDVPTKLKRKGMATLIDELGELKADAADIKEQIALYKLAIEGKLAENPEKYNIRDLESEELDVKAHGKTYEMSLTKYIAYRFNKSLFVKQNSQMIYDKYRTLKVRNKKMTISLRPEIKNLKKKF